MKQMFKILPLILSFVSTLLLISCQPNTSDNPSQSGPTFSSKKVQESFKEVMEIHDEVMPFITNMRRDKKSLESLLTTEDKNQAEKDQITAAIQKLTTADSLMFAWMGNFKTPDSKMPEAEALPYLKKEKDRVFLVNLEMKKAIKQAKSILEQTSEK